MLRVLMVSLLCTGCGGRSALLQPPAAGSPAWDGGDGLRLPDAARDGAPGDAGCRVLLRVGKVTPSPASCWIDQRVSEQTAALVWDCGSGQARADFKVPFVGTVSAGVAALTATTTFPWSDGCTWRSQQRIDGRLASGALTYSYSEAPITGTACAPAYCKATAPVVVQ